MKINNARAYRLALAVDFARSANRQVIKAKQLGEEIHKWVQLRQEYMAKARKVRANG